MMLISSWRRRHIGLVRSRCIAKKIKVGQTSSKLDQCYCKSMFSSEIHPSKPLRSIKSGDVERASPIVKLACTEFLGNQDVNLIIEDQRMLLKHGYISPLPTPQNSKRETYSMILKYVEIDDYSLYFKQKGQVYVTKSFSADIIHISKYQFQGYYESN